MKRMVLVLVVAAAVAAASAPARTQGFSDAKVNEMIVGRALAEGKSIARSYAEIEARKNCGKAEQNPLAGWEAYKGYIGELLAGLPPEFAGQRDASVAKDFAHYETKYAAISKSCMFMEESTKEIAARNTAKQIGYNTVNIKNYLKKLKPMN
jgi:hypothetical protein